MEKSITALSRAACAALRAQSLPSSVESSIGPSSQVSGRPSLCSWMALVGINEGAGPHEGFLRPAFSPTDCAANAAKSSLARQRFQAAPSCLHAFLDLPCVFFLREKKHPGVSRDASNTELSEVAETQEGSSEESVEWTPLAGGYTQATGQFPSLHSNWVVWKGVLPASLDLVFSSKYNAQIARFVAVPRALTSRQL